MLTIFILFLSFIYGNYSINQNNKKIKEINEKFHIKVISPKFNLEYWLSKKYIKERFTKFLKNIDPNKNKKTLFVWPEGVFSGYSYSDIKILKNLFDENFSENHLIIFGVNRLDSKKNKFYNSLVVINNQMKIIQEYKKQKLVPFGEFLPFEKILNNLGLKKITEDMDLF